MQPESFGRFGGTDRRGSRPSRALAEQIVKSQRAEVLTAAILGHACQEGRHALGLKKLAIKLGGARFDSYAPETLLRGEETEAYFQDLDQF